MTTWHCKLANPPVVEAVLDIDCDLPPSTKIESIAESAGDLFRGEYPKFRTNYIFEHEFLTGVEEPPAPKSRRDILGYAFLHEDEKQLIQVRAQGYSFNRLAPYSTLDDYKGEIEQTWKRFVELTKPVSVTTIRLRYINRIVLPLVQGGVELDDYLNVGPKLPGEGLFFKGFLNQYLAEEEQTGNEVRTILTSQAPYEGNLPIILDITAAAHTEYLPDDWEIISERIHSLRQLKNNVFFNTLKEEKCRLLFQ